MQVNELWALIKGFLENKGYEIRKHGKEGYAILCPFHDEQTPSFVITPNLGCGHCFSCGARASLWKLAKHFGLVGDDNLDKLISFAQKYSDTATKIVERLRKIPPSIAKAYGVGYLKHNSAILIPHPSPSDYNGAIYWFYKERRYASTKGMSKILPFGVWQVNSKPVWVVEGAFDAMALRVMNSDAVATLGGQTIMPSLHLYDGSLILAPDNDNGGEKILQRWIDEIKENPHFWQSVYVCRWRSKDPNEALINGTLEKEMQIKWLPVWVIVNGVLKHKEAWRAVLHPYISSMPTQVYQDAIKEATAILHEKGVYVNLPTEVTVPVEPEWVVVLRSALNDYHLLLYLLDQPDFTITSLPTNLQTVALQSIMRLGKAGKVGWVKSPYSPLAVSWAYRQARKALENRLKRWELS